MKKGDSKHLIGKYSVQQIGRYYGRQHRLGNGFALFRDGQIIESGISYERCLRLAGFNRVPYADPICD